MAISLYDHVCLLPVQSLLRRRPKPVLLLHRLGGVAWGLFSIVIVLCALAGAVRLPLLLWVAAVIFVVHSAISHKEYRYISPALPLIMTLAGVGSAMGPSGWRAGSANLGSGARFGRRAARLDRRLRRLGGFAQPHMVLGSLSRIDPGDARDQRGQESLRRGIYPGDMWWRASGYAGLRPGIPLFNAGETANPIAPNAYNYVISLQPRSRERQGPADLSADFADLGFQQVQCWTDPYDRAMLRSACASGSRPGTCDSASGKPLTPDVGEAFEELTR